MIMGNMIKALIVAPCYLMLLNQGQPVEKIESSLSRYCYDYEDTIERYLAEPLNFSEPTRHSQSSVPMFDFENVHQEERCWLHPGSELTPEEFSLNPHELIMHDLERQLLHPKSDRVFTTANKKVHQE
ncbi:hypothetical protein PGTUg99_012497 [Puccinia graminis f. sp. tritici]|uniref:Uncharacterized protein n=1 Tax=Puccinia graminis f. sp. tritici TaxID=56615 RepID=A0A5B0QZZ3_PUCGR|nr:hypothetical protein PGTUg99_012497 [Puccinia graminis f. sp. tritici]